MQSVSSPVIHTETPARSDQQPLILHNEGKISVLIFHKNGKCREYALRRMKLIPQLAILRISWK